MANKRESQYKKSNRSRGIKLAQARLRWKSKQVLSTDVAQSSTVEHTLPLALESSTANFEPKVGPDFSNTSKSLQTQDLLVVHINASARTSEIPCYLSKAEAIDALSSLLKRIQPCDLAEVVSQVLPGWIQPPVYDYPHANDTVKSDPPETPLETLVEPDIHEELCQEDGHTEGAQEEESKSEPGSGEEHAKEDAQDSDYSPDVAESSSSSNDTSAGDEDNWEETQKTIKKEKAKKRVMDKKRKERGKKETSEKEKPPKEKCDYCDKYVVSLSKHMKVHTIKKLLCPHCGKVFTTSSGLLLHVRTHTGNMFYCDQCPKAFYAPGLLTTHVQYRHLNQAAFACSLCPKKFVRAVTLRNHVARVHEKIRNCLCPECGKAFGSPGSLIRHRLLHSGKRECRCDLCGATFTNNWNLKVHKRSHESNPDFLKNKEWFSCPRCHVRCGNKKGLETHLKSHV